LAIFSLIAIATMASGVLLIPQLANATETGDTTQQVNDLPSWKGNCIGFGRRGMRFGIGGSGSFGPVEVSEEFKETVINIAGNDTDVQNLIAGGYNPTSVRPIIKTVIDAEGNIATKATSAVLTLQKDTTGHSSVLVDIEQAKVTQIVILTRTVIDKP